MADIPGGQVSAASLIASGLASLERKDLDRAVADFSEAIKIDPKSASAYRHRGNAYARKRDFKSAVADFNQAIALAPTDATAFYFRGRARHLANDLAGAISDYDIAIKLNPNHLKAFQYRETLLADKGIKVPASSETVVTPIRPLLDPETTNGSEVQVTLKRLMAIGWLLLWRGQGVGSAIGFLIGFVISFVAAALWQKQHVHGTSLLIGVLTFTIGLAWGAVVLRMALLKRYRDFRIVLISNQHKETTITFNRVLVIWWFLTWRGALVVAAAFLAAYATTYVAVLVISNFHNPHEAELSIKALGFVVSFAISSSCGLLILKMALSKKYRDFRIALVSNQLQEATASQRRPVNAKDSIEPIPFTASSVSSKKKSPRTATVAEEWRFWVSAAAFAIVACTATWFYFRPDTNPTGQTEVSSMNTSVPQMPPIAPPEPPSPKLPQPSSPGLLQKLEAAVTPVSAPKCDDDEVVDTFLDQFVCEGLLNCRNVGIANYRTLHSMSDADVTNAVESYFHNGMRLKSKGIPQPTSGELTMLERYVANLVSGYLAARDVVREVNIFPKNYNPQIGRYTCQASVLIDKASMSKVLFSTTFFALMKGDMGDLLALEAKGDKDINMGMKIATATVSRMVPLELQCVKELQEFTVQPTKSAKTPFVVTYDFKNEWADQDCLKQ